MRKTIELTNEEILKIESQANHKDWENPSSYQLFTISRSDVSKASHITGLIFSIDFLRP